jgi:predicted ribosome quality control (RQC) complex YloA/Tae2 family protein
MRDQRIDDLQNQLNTLLLSIETGSGTLTSQSANESIALLIEQVETLKDDKKADESLDQNRDSEVRRLREYASKQDESISRLTNANKVLRENLEAIMIKLGMIKG